uniref:Pentatricopeptide repeat-containing protein At3g05240 family n=1 Tax=Cajanus cajan TaxID=3821 RepID=A0A151TWB9_CAJCA|nr:Putative pentatricopeptide repeat-containing protein At3g05240 family [Cajanus cajan]
MSELKKLHGLIVTTPTIKSIIPLSKLIDFCVDSEFGDISYADLVFRQIDNPSVYIWNSMIRGFVNGHNPRMSILLYSQMIENGYSPDHFTFPFVLKASSLIADQDCGKCTHSRIVKSGFEADVYTATGLLHMYVSCADMKSGLKVFDNIPKWNVVAWTCLISGNIILATAILEMYAKCGSLKIARDLFNKMPQRNIVSWNSMINAYNQYERHQEALDLFFDMWSNGFHPDKATFLSVLSVCAHQCGLALGQTVHAYLLKTGIATDIALATALLNMYAKTGELGSAQKIFNSLQKKDVVVWTSMINGLAMHGHGNEALSMFQTMQEDSSLVPDHITYIGVLFACSHVGLIEEAQKHFRLMIGMYGIMPRREHYGCLVDLLSRAGLLGEAERLLETMSVQPNIPIWGAILNGCQIHENLCVANQVKVRLAELEPDQSGVHVLLSNIYAKAGRWEEVNVTRKVMKHRRIAKTIGHSSVEMKLLS